MHTRTACPVWPVPVACRIHFEIVELRDREHACEAQRGQGMAWMDSWGGGGSAVLLVFLKQHLALGAFIAWAAFVQLVKSLHAIEAGEGILDGP